METDAPKQNAIESTTIETNPLQTDTIVAKVGMASCGIAAGAEPVFNELNKIKDIIKGITLDVKKVGCIGCCYAEPILEVKKGNDETIIFQHVEPKDVKSIINSVKQNKVHKKFFAKRRDGKRRIPGAYIESLSFYKYQEKRVSHYCGIIEPENINDYLNIGGYENLKKALSMSRNEIIDIIDESGLRGRGGAGFPTGKKWKVMQKAKKPKYLICNFDEGDPGAFMNRVLVESNPHLLLEGILITAYALDVDKAYIYTRAEYPLAVERLKKAIQQAKDKNIFGAAASLINIDIELFLGAGAYVCGEETALISSLEGKTGRPHPKPPYPFQKGLFGRPTNINNVETLANVPLIIEKGPKWFREKGTKTSPGTKIFSFSGAVKHGGYVEVPLGTELNKFLKITDVKSKEIKGVQLGGPSGGCISLDYLDLPIDYDHVNQANVMMGSGSFVIIPKDQDIVELARYFLSFNISESCGQCVPCREGTKRLYEILTKILENKGTNKDLNDLEELSLTIKQTSLCGLGKAAPNPVLSVIRNFRGEFVKHFIKGSLEDPSETFYINPSKCNGCHICFDKCPVSAITGRILSIHYINQQSCIRCGTCYHSCPIKAIEVRKIEEINHQ